MNKLLLHLEGLAVLALSVYFYFSFDFSWVLFILLLLAPDLSMLGYIINNRIGAVLYNCFHTYLGPIIIILIAVVFSHELLLALGIIWTAHIGMDRMIGYGLKYPTHFKDTHLNRI